MRYEPDDLIQEWFSDDSVNVRCVLSWNCARTSRESIYALKVNFHNLFYFDSERSVAGPERLNDTLSELKRISSYPPAAEAARPVQPDNLAHEVRSAYRLPPNILPSPSSECAAINRSKPRTKNEHEDGRDEAVCS